ncbi:MAG TPA: protein kinase [Candidatus Methylomirabilis sp.]|nr:protein kinase [Candidatus Methylomirabilis sp.]
MDQYQYVRGVVVGGRYKLEEPLGAGGMAEVWRATDQRMTCSVAIKFMKFDLLRTSLLGPPTGASTQQELVAKQFSDRFIREVQIMGKLIQDYNRSYLVRIHDTDTDDYGNLYYVMDYVQGRPLEAEIDAHANRMGLPSPGEFVVGANQAARNRVPRTVYPILDLYRLSDQILDVIGYLHANSVIHRDIKPSNLMLVRDTDGRPSIRLLDFGIAKIADEALSAVQQSSRMKLTLENQQMGTPDYMPEESFFGRSLPDETGKAWETGPYTDLYAVAMILFEAVTGRMPYVELNNQERMWILRKYEIPVPDPGYFVEDLNPRLRDVILKGLAKQPWMRYQDATIMRNDLRLAEKIDKERIHAVSEAQTLNTPIPLSYQPTVPHERVSPLPAASAHPAPLPEPPSHESDEIRLTVERQPTDDVPPAEGRTRTTLKSVSDEDLPPRPSSKVVPALVAVFAVLFAAGAYLFLYAPSQSKAPATAPVEAPTLANTAVQTSVPPTPPTPVIPVSDRERRKAGPPNVSAEQAFKTGRMIASGPAKDCRGAIPFFEEARKAAPNWPNAYLELGECQRKLGRLDQARESYRIYASFEGVPPLPPAALALVR